MQLTLAYRPPTFSAVVGHSTIVTELVQRGIEGSYPQVMLLSGPTGIGKTSLALNVAKVIDCVAPSNGEPCNECPSCQSVLTERYDKEILVIDSTRLAKTDIAELEESVSYQPVFSRKRVVIVEEVQELLAKSQSAFLKLIEIPRENVYFIFTSMDASKLNKAFVNRCTHYRLRGLSTEEMGLYLLRLLDGMKLKIDKATLDAFASEGLVAIVEGSDGSLRDALSYLERCIYGNIWTTELIQQEFGLTTQENMMNLLWAMVEGKPDGIDPAAYTKEFYYRSFKFLTNAAMYFFNKKAKTEFASKQYERLLKSPNFFPLVNVFKQTHIDCNYYYRDEIFLLHLMEYYRTLSAQATMQKSSIPTRRLAE